MQHLTKPASKAATQRAAQAAAALEIPEAHRFAPGDLATFTVYSDAHAGWIESVSPNGRKVTFREGHARLLNGANSGEPDALKVTPGGFSAHTEGKQRWEITPNPQGALTTFTLRQYTVSNWNREAGKPVAETRWIWKRVGHNTNSPGLSLHKGHHHHYDFNF